MDDGETARVMLGQGEKKKKKEFKEAEKGELWMGLYFIP